MKPQSFFFHYRNSTRPGTPLKQCVLRGYDDEAFMAVVVMFRGALSTIVVSQLDEPPHKGFHQHTKDIPQATPH